MIRALVAVVCLLGVAPAARAGDDVTRDVDVGGRERSYRLHVPEPTPGGELPLVVVLHGAGGNGRLVALGTGFSAEADARGFAVAYPDGTRSRFAALLTPLRGRHFTWNAGDCCGWAREHEIDDVAALRAIVEDAARVTPIDRARVYAAGLSNGGMMAYRLACEASDLFAAVAVVSGALVTPGCAPTQPVSVLHIHGARDRIVPIDGGAGAYTRSTFTYPPTETAIDFWQSANGCDPTPEISSPAEGVTLRRYGPCRGGAEVELVRLESSRHGWPDDASQRVWQFFASHSRR